MMDISKYEFGIRDELGRKAMAEKINTLLSSEFARDFFPLLIDGDWGAGKTEFLFKLKNHLSSSTIVEDKSIKLNPDLYVSYINAFSTDYYHDPFMVIVREVYDLLGQRGSRKDLQGLFRIIKKAAPEIVGTMANIGISLLPGATTIKQTMDAMSKISKAIDKAQELAYEKQLNEFLTSVNSLSDFKAILQKTIEEIGGRYVLIIDELDRCKPDYAVKLLEMAKHLFDVKGLYIIYGANSKYLEANISKTYMDGDYSESYLAKFFNLKMVLTAKLDKSVPSTNDLDDNYEYFQNTFLKDIHSFNRLFQLVDGTIKLQKGLETLKVNIVPLIGGRELREREKMYKCILLIQELNADLFSLPDSFEVERAEIPIRIFTGMISLMLAVSLFLDGEHALIDKILAADIFLIPNPNEVGDYMDHTAFSGQTCIEVEEIKKYLLKIQASLDLRHFYSYLVYDQSGWEDRGFVSIGMLKGQMGFDNRFYGLKILREALESLKGIVLK